MLDWDDEAQPKGKIGSHPPHEKQFPDHVGKSADCSLTSARILKRARESVRWCLPINLMNGSEG